MTYQFFEYRFNLKFVYIQADIALQSSYNLSIYMFKDNQRKNSEEIYSQSEDQASNLFPKSSTIDLQNCLEILKEHYNKNLHYFELTNYCYRCHNQEFISAYRKFKDENHQELQEPKISSIYQNKSFVDLEELSKRIKKQPFQIPGPYIPPIPKNFKNILNQLFQKNGYIPNLERFLIYYPTYLERHLLVYNILFQSDKIDSKIAYFLGICAAAELGSVYIMARMIKKFLKEGGLINWITEAKYPSKYKLIFEINRMMARAPWQITPQMIQNILQNNNSHWTKNELALCLQILAFTHQMSTIALSIGVLPQESSHLGILNLNKILELKSNYDNKVYSPNEQSTQKLASLIPIINAIQDNQNKNTQEKLEPQNQKNGLPSQQSKKSMKKQKRLENTDNYMKEIANQLTSQEIYKDINKLVQPLLPPFFLFQDRKYLKSKVLDYSDFNFKFMAYPILYSLSDGVAVKFQSLIDYSQIMTRGNFGIQKINNTKQFRKAVRYYSQNLCFYTHHQYDFKNNVGLYLTMALKFYIRLITLSPVHINKQVIQSTNHQCGEQIQCFDLGHLAVMVANTKMSLQLTMAIQAFEF